MLLATRGSRGLSENLLGAACQLGLQTVHQAPINAPAQSQMEQNNSALPLTIQMTPLGILGSLIAINSFTWCWTICAALA